VKTCDIKAACSAGEGNIYFVKQDQRDS